MRALTVRQPWASLIVAGIKCVENRTWPCEHRGPLLIHAAVTPDDIDEALGLLDGPFPLGAIIGQVRLLDVVRYSARRFKGNPWAEGPWCWVLGGAVRLRHPVSCKGRLSLWEPGQGVLEAVLAQLK
jgi:hypothetical protein